MFVLIAILLFLVCVMFAILYNMSLDIEEAHIKEVEFLAKVFDIVEKHSNKQDTIIKLLANIGGENYVSDK